MKDHSRHDALDLPEVQGREREHELRRAAGESSHAHGHGDDHGGHAGHAEVYRRRFWINLILAVPVFVYSETIQDWFGFTPPQFPGDGLVAPVLGTVIFLYGGAVFLTGAWSEVRRRAPGMMLLVSLAITVSFARARPRCSDSSISSSGGSSLRLSSSCCLATGRRCRRSGRRAGR